MPYDRERTTLRVFPLCPDCRAEYEDPNDRRFHAESIACPACGPKLTLTDGRGRPVPGDPLTSARGALARGRILAVRSIGGFQLAVDATDKDAVNRLRRRKLRPHKPFAVMARDLGVLKRHCRVSDRAAELLSGPEGPIVICDLLERRDQLPADALSPDTATLGAMLPTSPLHELLFSPLAGDETPPFDLLVMTSGNRGGEPICITNPQALERLGTIADFVLSHDREINLRNDDSVCVLTEPGDRPQVWRRARGYAPAAVRLKTPLGRCVLAVGADLKNTVSVGFGDRVTLSPHVGDLETPEALTFLAETAERLPAFLGRRPEVVAVDLHPDLRSTRFGVELARRLGLQVVYVQHHHAHAAACLAENHVDDALALAFDGTGWGTDGNVWGAELLWVTPEGFERLGSFSPVPLPGGDAAVLDPRRQLTARWVDAGVQLTPGLLNASSVSDEEAEVWAAQCEKSINAPLTHGAGRLFDAFSCALGLAPDRITYEARAAVRLETCARTYGGGSVDLLELPFGAQVDSAGLLMIDWADTFRRVGEGLPGLDGPGWAMAFHCAVAKAALQMAVYGRKRTSRRKVALSGGVFMNRLLTGLLIPLLEDEGFEVLTHRAVPPNDGGISLGQAVVAGRVA
jgi:hydrogenase maturation protein HypF